MRRFLEGGDFSGDLKILFTILRNGCLKTISQKGPILEIGTSSGGPNVENVNYLEDDDVGGPNMEDGDHMNDNHAEDDEDYTSISDQSDENQSISEGSRESDEEVEDRFATKNKFADVALRENPGLGSSLEDKLLQIFNKSFSARTLGPHDMSTQNDTKVLQKRPPKSSQPVLLTQKTTSKPTGGGRRKRQGISDRTIIVHPNPTPMQEDDEGNESDEDYYIGGEGGEEEEEKDEERVPSTSCFFPKEKENGRGSQE
ncbi:OLC1v1008920C1 [Oldenlandia corymbosa var. corymbosa]|uniref:OLC1v1008920C1 n=1 Tax=Oldenlandia corymbosa var. corymbosa TaxID=529605 RepID=A0AAV1DMR0_OLDCO|nr:OLC1v1008920C1 [Oldenlandia corymbosa var. corymbosa]